MKRIYIAAVFIMLAFFTALFEISSINNISDRTIRLLEKTQKLVENNQTEKAENLCKKTASEFYDNSKNILYCFYRHDELEEIADRLYNLEDYLDDKRIEEFHETSHSVKKQLLTLKDKELLTIQNIL